MLLSNILALHHSHYFPQNINVKQQQSKHQRSQDNHNGRSQARPCASDVKSNWPGQNDESENIARTEKKAGAVQSLQAASRAAVALASDTLSEARASPI